MWDLAGGEGGRSRARRSGSARGGAGGGEGRGGGSDLRALGSGSLGLAERAEGWMDGRMDGWMDGRMFAMSLIHATAGSTNQN